MKIRHSHNHEFEQGALLEGLLDASERTNAHLIRKTIIVGCIVNLMLMLLKLIVGHYGHSDALVADGFHSLNDFGADLLMLLFIGISFRPADSKYSYGYGKFETFSTFLISLLLLVIAGHIGHEAIESISEYSGGASLPRPELSTVVVVIVAMIGKEFLFRYYKRASEKTGVTALLTNAWHHRADALASIATLIGVSFAHFLGEPWRILDPCASLVIMIFIIVPAVRMLWGAFTELMDKSCPRDICGAAEKIVANTQGVRSVEKIKSRRNGHFKIFDITIAVAKGTTIDTGYAITSEVDANLKKEFGKNIMVSVNIIPV